MALECDLDKSFDENIAEFRKHLEALDPDCANIFFDNQAKLLGDGNPSRNRANRTAFNDAVLAQLEALSKKSDGDL